MADITAPQAALLVTQMPQLLRASSQAREDGAALLQALSLMSETQGVHTEMLREILTAASEEPAESPMAGLFEALTETLAAQTAQLERVAIAIDQLPKKIAVAVQQGVQAALADAC